MESFFKGDTFSKNYTVTLDDGDYEFANGDVLKVAFFDLFGKPYAQKTHKVTTPTNEIQITWSHEETEDLRGLYVLQVNITTSTFSQTNQDFVYVNNNDVYAGDGDIG